MPVVVCRADLKHTNQYLCFCSFSHYFKTFAALIYWDDKYGRVTRWSHPFTSIHNNKSIIKTDDYLPQTRESYCRAAVVDRRTDGQWEGVKEKSDGVSEWNISKTSRCLFWPCSSTSSSVLVPALRASSLHGATAWGRSWNIHSGCEETWGKLHGKLKGQSMGGGWGMENSLTKHNFFLKGECNQSQELSTPSGG